MKKSVKISLIVLIVFVIAVAATLGCLVLTELYKKRDVRGTPFEGLYSLDESGRFIADIPFGEYLYTPEYPADEKIFDIRDYGADVSAGFAENRKAINDAIAAANAAGGGVVYVDGGEYVCANIRLMSLVTLRIARGSALTNIDHDTAASMNSDYFSSGQNAPAYNGFIYGIGLNDVTIEGPGKIKGNGTSYCENAEEDTLFYPLDTFNLKNYVLEHRKRIMPGKAGETERNYILAFSDCKNLTVRNVELYETASWTCRMEGNENLTFSDVVINNNIRVANSDGIDIVGGTDILIKNCFIAAGDDGICLKTEKDGKPVSGVTVRNCTVASLANCFKIGTETYLPVSDVRVSDCEFFLPGIAGGYAGIAVEATDGGKTSDIHIDNIVMHNITSPLLIWLGDRHKGSELENVSVKNVTAYECDLPSAVTGYKGCSVKNVVLENFSVTYREAVSDTDIYLGDSAYRGSLNTGGYPEITRVSHIYLICHELSFYWDLPVYGLYVNDAENVEVYNYSVTPRSDEKRPASNFSAFNATRG